MVERRGCAAGTSQAILECVIWGGVRPVTRSQARRWGQAGQTDGGMGTNLHQNWFTLLKAKEGKECGHISSKPRSRQPIAVLALKSCVDEIFSKSPWDAPAESREAGDGFQEINQQVSEELMKRTRQNGLNIYQGRKSPTPIFLQFPSSKYFPVPTSLHPGRTRAVRMRKGVGKART